MSQFEPNQFKDELLLEQIAAGCKQAFNALFEKHWEKAYSDAYKRLKNQDDAKDVVQEIFTYIWINKETLHIENLPAYLHVAIRNRVIKLITKQKLIHPYFDVLDTIPAKSSQADAPLLWKEFLASCECFFKSLPPKRQQIFRLRYQEYCSTKEISNKMNISRKTVQNQLRKAVETLKVSLLRIFLILILCYPSLFNCF